MASKAVNKSHCIRLEAKGLDAVIDMSLKYRVHFYEKKTLCVCTRRGQQPGRKTGLFSVQQVHAPVEVGGEGEPEEIGGQQEAGDFVDAGKVQGGADRQGQQ